MGARGQQGPCGEVPGRRGRRVAAAADRAGAGHLRSPWRAWRGRCPAAALSARFAARGPGRQVLSEAGLLGRQVGLEGCAVRRGHDADRPPPRASGSQAVRAKGHLWTPPLSPSKVRLPVVSAGALAPSSVTLSPFVVTGVSSLKQVLRPPPTCHIPRAQGQCLFWSLLLTRGLNARLRLTVLGAGPRSRRWQVRSLLRPGFRVHGWLSAGCVLTRRRDHGPLGSL